MPERHGEALGADALTAGTKPYSATGMIQHAGDCGGCPVLQQYESCRHLADSACVSNMHALLIKDKLLVNCFL